MRAKKSDLRLGGGYRPRELRIRLYGEVLKLREQGLGYKRIQGLIERKYGERLSLAVISHWVRGIHSPLNGRRIPSIEYLKPSRELSYIIGSVFGDGCVVEVKKNGRDNAFVSLRAKDGDFVREFARCLGIVLDRKPPKIHYIQSRQQYHMHVSNKTLFELLRGKELDKVRSFIEYSDGCKAAFLRGLSDAEGCSKNTLHGLI